MISKNIPLDLDVANNSSNYSNTLDPINMGIPRMQFNSKSGTLYQGDATQFLKTIPSGSVDLIIADPPYSIKKAEWDTFSSQENYVNWSLEWIIELLEF